MKNICILIFAFICCNSIFADDSFDLKGEWVTTCLKKGDYYYSDTLVYFNRTEVVHSWKAYNDPDCEEDPVGESWGLWEITSEEPSPLGEGIVEITNTLKDGWEVDYICAPALSIRLKKDNQLYFGEKYFDTDRALKCDERPTELAETPFVFSRPINQSPQEYVKSLNRKPLP